MECPLYSTIRYGTLAHLNVSFVFRRYALRITLVTWSHRVWCAPEAAVLIPWATLWYCKNTASGTYPYRVSFGSWGHDEDPEAIEK